MNSENELIFILLDLDYKINPQDQVPTLRLFGKTKREKILFKVKDFLPYFYVTQKNGLKEFIDKDPIIKKWMIKTDVIRKKRYFGGELLSLLKIYGSHPEETPKVKERLEKEGYEIHEADIPFVKRFLLDVKIRSLNVLKAKVDSITKEGQTVIAEGSYLNLQMASKEVIPSTDAFYKLKLMTFDIEVNHQNETIQQLLEENKKRITAISIFWGTNQFDHQKAIFILNEDSDNAERIVINDFLSALHDIQPDVLISFNGDNFDLPYLLGRMEQLKIQTKNLSLFQSDSVFYSNRARCYRILGRISYDISPRTWAIHPLSGKKGLGDIAETILGKKKVSLEKTTGELWYNAVVNRSKEDFELFKKYSLNDSLLTYELLWKLGIQGWLEIIRLTGFPPGEAPGSTERIQGEFELMRFLCQQGVLIPSAPTDQEVTHRRNERRKNPHTGGTVLIPKGCLHFGVIISDFRSMYPSVCVAHNIGGETLKHLNDLDNSNPIELFHSKPQSCLSLMEETLINHREKTKKKIKEISIKLEQVTDLKEKKKLLEEKEILDKEQYSLKIIANSMYGAHNYIRSRFYSITLGNAITNIARTYILRMEELLEEVSKKITPVEIIYGDTDSAFIKILDSSLVTKIYAEIEPVKKQKLLANLLSQSDNILKALNEKFPKAMEITLEDIAYKLIFKPGRAKAYSYFSILQNKLKIKGFEAVRSDWSSLSRDAQKKVLELILTAPSNIENNIHSIYKKGEKTLDLGIIMAKDFLVKLGLEILKMPLEELIQKALVMSPIKRNPQQYKTKVPAVLAFLDFTQKENLNPYEVWKEYDKFPWVVTLGKGLISERAKHPKYAKDVDREYYIAEILRASEGFGVKLSLQEIKNALTMEPIDKIFERLPKEKIFDESNHESKNIATSESKIKKHKQTELGGFIKDL